MFELCVFWIYPITVQADNDKVPDLLALLEKVDVSSI